MIVPCDKRMPSWTAGLLLTLLSACSGLAGSGPPTHYYVLSTVPESAVASAGTAENGPVVSVAPVILPGYLDQLGITTRDPGNKVTRADFDRWAGPLNTEVTRAVGENLSVMVPTGRLLVASSGRPIPADFLVQIEIAEFERNPANAVQLIARWTVFTHDGDTLLVMRTSRVSRPADGADYGSTVAAMSGAVEDLCREIASTIRTAETQKISPTAKRPASARGAS